MEIVNGTSLIAMRSIASKLVATDELGKRRCKIKDGFLLSPPFFSCSFAISGKEKKTRSKRVEAWKRISEDFNSRDTSAN